MIKVALMMMMMMMMMMVSRVRSEAEQQDQYLDELEHLSGEGKRSQESPLDHDMMMRRSDRRSYPRTAG